MNCRTCQPENMSSITVVSSGPRVGGRVCPTEREEISLRSSLYLPHVVVLEQLEHMERVSSENMTLPPSVHTAPHSLAVSVPRSTPSHMLHAQLMHYICHTIYGPSKTHWARNEGPCMQPHILLLVFGRAQKVTRCKLSHI